MPDNRLLFERLGTTMIIIRTVKGISQAELAIRAGIRPNQVSRYETGQVLPQLVQLAKILDALEIDLTEFVLAMRLMGWMEELLTPGDRTRPLSSLPEVLVAELYQISIGEIDAVRQALREFASEAPSCT